MAGYAYAFEFKGKTGTFLITWQQIMGSFQVIMVRLIICPIQDGNV